MMNDHVNRRSRAPFFALVAAFAAAWLVTTAWAGPLEPLERQRGGVRQEVKANAEPIRFAVIGDFGSGSKKERDVADMIKTWNPDFIITAGDNRYGRTDYDLVIGQFFCDYLKDVGEGVYCAGGNATVNAFFPSVGNHDYSDGGGINEYLSYFNLPGADFSSRSNNKRYYDFVWGPVHFFALNSNPMEPDGASANSAQAQWLKTQLMASTSTWRIVYFHHAPYSSSLVHGSYAPMQWPFAAWGADAVIAGHTHTYERLEVDGIPYFVNGLGGKSIYGMGPALPESKVRYNGDYGAMLVEADPHRLRFRFVTRSGKVIDAYILPAPTPTPAPWPHPFYLPLLFRQLEGLDLK
ncbi:MAG: alkaline phosphatase [Chloroflexi bacterium]|nr:alkaline phosphatase [Chloroflexota bacterium]